MIEKNGSNNKSNIPGINKKSSEESCGNEKTSAGHFKYEVAQELGISQRDSRSQKKIKVK